MFHKALIVLVVAVACAGCRTAGRGCHEPGPYAQAQSIPPLRIPVGLETPDTRSALRIPDLNEPEPPPRKPSDPCLDEPPKYTAPEAPKPPPAT